MAIMSAMGFRYPSINYISVNRPAIRRFVPMQVAAFEGFAYGYNTF